MFNQKEVFIISMMNFSTSNAGVARVKNYALALSAQNISVYLITCFNKRVVKNDLIKIDRYIYQNKQNNNHFPKLLIGKYHFLKSLITLTPKNKDKVFLFYPSTKFLLEYFVIIYLKFIKRQKVFLELNEIRKYSVTTSNISNPLIGLNLKSLKKIIKLTAAYLSEILFKYYSGIIVISNNLYNYAHINNLNKIIVPILSRIELKDDQTPNKKYIINIIKIGFFGTINIKKENLDIFINALSKLKPKNQIVFHLYGECDAENKKQLNYLIKKLDLNDTISLKGIITHEDLCEALKQYHLLVLPRGNTKQNMYGFSTKLSEYLVSGVPTLLTDVSDNGRYIKDNYNGFIVEPDSEEAFVNKIEFIIKNYDEIHERIATNAFFTAKKHFDYKNYSKLLSDFLFN